MFAEFMASQPQFAAKLRSDFKIGTALTAVGGVDGDFKTLTGAAWTRNNAAFLKTAVGPLGVSVQNTGSGYFSRPGPNGNPMTIVMTYTPTAVSGSNGIWSCADVYNSAGPAILMQQSGSNIVLHTVNGGITVSGVLIPGVPCRIVLSLLATGTYSAMQVILAINGAVYTNSGLTGGSSWANEFIGSGYNGQAKGYYGEFFTIDRFITVAQARSLSENPWQLFLSPRKSRLVGVVQTLTSRRALYWSGTAIAEVTDAQIGTGKKPIVLMGDGSLKERSASEGSPVIFADGELRCLNGTTEVLVS